MHILRHVALVRTGTGIMLLLGVAVLGCAGTEPALRVAASETQGYSAVVPAERLDLDWWKTRHEGVLKQIAGTNPDILMIGDSITHGWDNHGEIWEAHFGEYSMVNMGFGGDRTQHVLWRLEHGEIEGISPRLAVLMIGTNNSNRSDNTAEEIGDGIAAICVKLRAELPEMEILVLAIFPRGEGPSSQREKNRAASNAAEKWAKSDAHVYYLNFGGAFLDSNEMLPEDVMPDFLHPNAKGYEIWASEMEDEVNRLLSR